MKDRVPLYPGRVKLEPVAGQENIYDMTRADSPQQIGTKLNKANLLTDETVQAIFGALDDSKTPNDAFAALAVAIASGTKIQTGSYVGTGTYGSANPCSLTFDFEPKLIIICGRAVWLASIFVNPSPFAYSGGNGQSSNGEKFPEIALTWGDNNVNWYASGRFMGGSGSSTQNAWCQLNASTDQYFYIAIS